ncbi:MAG: glycogen synthase [Oscillospiraceae bacterium]|nr:glycogen synthase [Oscillospiraceae bacterium]
MKSVLMATAEFSPFVKAGGLGDVVGALPFALRKEGVDARVVMPLYTFIPSKIAESLKFVKETYVNMGWRKQNYRIFEINYNGLPMYFIDSELYFSGPRLYYEMENDIERFAFFCAAVLNALPHIDFAPGVVHCHDWHTSLIPVLLQAHYKKMQYFRAIKTIVTIHNLKYQGICNKYKLFDILGINEHYSVAGSLSFGYDIANCLKGGISVADKITTVSDAYAREIRDPYYGEGLDWLLNWRGYDLVGIVNGIDNRQYDPSRDGAIAVNYTAANAAQAKKQNKAALQAEFGLSPDPDRPVIALISRLVEQKGLDLIIRVFDEILASPEASDLGPQFVILGTGDERYENFFKWKQTQCPGGVAARIVFDDSMARRIYAGADFLLMPSLFEPCGISQLLAMRYGTIPIVRETGGLSDTVKSYDESTGEGNGYSFKSINAHDMLYTIRRALGFYGGIGSIHDKIRQSAMAGDFSWDQSARKYIELYNYL